MEGRGQVRRMVLHRMNQSIQYAARHALPLQDPNIAPRLPILPAAPHQAWIWTLCQDVVQLADEIGTAVLIDRDVVDLGQRDTRLAQTKCDRLRGKASPVLDAAKAFLFCS